MKTKSKCVMCVRVCVCVKERTQKVKKINITG